MSNTGLITEADVIRVDRNNALCTIVLNTTDVTQVNMLRRAMLSEIETYAIDIVTFNENTSCRHDEIVAFRLGQLVIDHDRFVPDENDQFTTEINVEGPLHFSTADIPGLPFKYVTPIMVLQYGQRINCSVIVKRGTSRIHAKWRPISTCAIGTESDRYTLTFHNIGMLPDEKIIEDAFKSMPLIAERSPQTIFSYPLIPADYKPPTQ